MIRVQVSKPPELLLSCVFWSGSGNFWRLTFPVSEMGNALAICGWTLANNFDRSFSEVRAELNRLESLPFLEIPNDPRAWFAKFGIRIVDATGDA